MRNLVASVGLVGLLGCEQNIPQKEYVPVSPNEDITASSITTQKRAYESSSCDVKRSELFNEILNTKETELQVLNYVYRKHKKEQQDFIEHEKKNFAVDAFDVAHDLIFNFREPWSPIKKEKRESFYNDARAVAYCLDPEFNFDKAIVEEAYKEAAQELRSGIIERVITGTINFGEDVASKNGIDNNSYAKQLVIDAYEIALYHLERRYVQKIIEVDLNIAREVAKENNVDDSPYKINFVDQAYKIAEKDRDRGYKYIRTDLRFAKQVATEANLTDQIAKLDSLEATLK